MRFYEQRHVSVHATSEMDTAVGACQPAALTPQGTQHYTAVRKYSTRFGYKHEYPKRSLHFRTGSYLVIETKHVTG